MLIFVEQRHIDAAQRDRRTAGIPWGCRCPVARAACEQLDLPLGSVYVGPLTAWVNWERNQADMVVEKHQSRWMVPDKASEFIAAVDNVCDDQDIEPCVVQLSQRPAHAPGHYTPEGWFPYTEPVKADIDTGEDSDDAGMHGMTGNEGHG